MVPTADFTSYYGRPVVKAAPWKWDIAAYLFTGGLMAGSSLLAAGAGLTGNRALRRRARFTAAGGLLASTSFLVHDLGRPGRFYTMLRVAKPSSPMSVGTWLLAAYGPAAGLAAASEATGLLPGVGSAAELAAAAVAPLIAAYTAVLFEQTSVPAWSDAHPDLPFVFVGSAAAAAGGMAMVLTDPAAAGAARRLAVTGAVGELAVATRMERRMGLTGEVYGHGVAGRWMRAARTLTGGGAVLAAVAGRRSRVASVVAGAALVAGSAATRMGVYHAGQQSAADPRYVVVPQRARLDQP